MAMEAVTVEKKKNKSMSELLEDFAATKNGFVPVEKICRDIVLYAQENDSHIPTRIAISYHMNRFSRYEIDGIESSGYRRVVIDEIKDLLLRLHGIYDRNIPRGVAFMFRELFKAGSLSEMKVPRIVASGRYADLWFSHTRIGESYGPWALKRFNEVNNEQQEYIMREAELMRALDGQEVVPRFVAYHWVDQRLKGLYMEWFERGSLYDAITDSTVSQRESWAIDLEKKLEHLHSLGVIHGDISPENILIANDDSIRFCDLHCSGEGRNCVGKERWYGSDSLTNSKESDKEATMKIISILRNNDISSF